MAPRAGATCFGCLAVMVVAAGMGCDRARSAAPAPALVELWLGGDVHLGGAAVRPDDVAQRLAPLAEPTGGLGIVNLEGAVGAGADAGELLFNHPDGLAGLRAAGVVVVGIANNHARDGGAEAPRRTIDALVRAGLVPAGLDAGDAVVTRDGLRLVVADHAVGDTPPAALRAALDAARKKGDVLVVSLHVVATPSYLPGPATVAAVEAAVAAGAAVVVVHGSHALARVERRGTTVIAWGLGNLLFSCACTDEEDGLLLRVTVGRDGAGRARIVPIDAGLHGAAAGPAHEPALIRDLLASLKSSPLAADGTF